MRDIHHLLLDALILPREQARDAWQQWRRTANLDRLDGSSFALLPALAGRMSDWIADDPQREILTGICRRGWSQQQVGRKLATEVVETLHASGIARVAWTGPLLWTHLYWPKGAVRATDLVDLLVEEAAVPAAVAALSKAGWHAMGLLPDWGNNSSYFTPAIHLELRTGRRLRLRWRELPNTDFALRRLPPPEIDWTREVQDRHRISAENALVGSLSDDYSDGIDWRYDALLLCRRPELDWDKVANLLQWRLQARARLEELCCEWVFAAPPAIARRLRVSRCDRLVISPLRCYRQAKFAIRRGVTHSSES